MIIGSVINSVINSVISPVIGDDEISAPAGYDLLFDNDNDDLVANDNDYLFG